MALNFPTSPTNGQVYVALGRGWKYDSTTGAWEALIRVNTAFDSDDITEGATNLYQNPENIQDEVNNLLQQGSNITLNYDDAANTLTVSSDLTNVASDLLPGANNTYDIGSTLLKWKDLHMQGDAVIDGNLTVNGSTTTINSTDLIVDDLNITIASGAADSAAADGAGITVDGASAEIKYVHSTTSWDFNKNVIVNGDLTVTGATTTLNTETLTVDDNIIVLNNNVTGVPSENAGIEIERGTSDNVTIRWNETTDKWQFTNDGTTYTDFGTPDIVNDTTPQLGGDLDLNSHDITGTGDINITGTVTATNLVSSLQGITYPSSIGSIGQVIKVNSAGTALEFGPVATTLAALTDVDVTGIADQNLIKWDSATSKFIDTTISSAMLPTTMVFVDEFTASGATNQFTLSQDPGSSNAVQVFVDGVPQLVSNYTVVGTTLTLGGTPTNGQIVEVRGYGIYLPIGTVADNSITGAKLQDNTISGAKIIDGTIGLAQLATGIYSAETFTGASPQVDFTLSNDPGTPQALLVIVDNVIQEPTENFTTNSTTLTFTSAPPTGARIYVRYLGLPSPGSTPSDGTVTNAKLNLTYSSNQFTGNGSDTQYTIEDGHTDHDVLVILDGLILPPTDYSIAGTTLTFTSAPLNLSSIDIRYMPV